MYYMSVSVYFDFLFGLDVSCPQFWPPNEILFILDNNDIKAITM